MLNSDIYKAAAAEFCQFTAAAAAASAAAEFYISIYIVKC